MKMRIAGLICFAVGAICIFIAAERFWYYHSLQKQFLRHEMVSDIHKREYLDKIPLLEQYEIFKTVPTITLYSIFFGIIFLVIGSKLALKYTCQLEQLNRRFDELELRMTETLRKG